MRNKLDKDLYNYGFIAGTLAVLLQLLYYLILDQFSTFGQISSVVLIVVNFIICLWSVIELKKRQNGYATFREVFSVFMINRIVNITLSIGFVVALYFWIDTDFRDIVIDKQLGTTMEKLSNANMPADQKISTLEAIENWSGRNIKVYLFTWLGYIVVNSIIGLIIAATFKKDEPVV